MLRGLARQHLHFVTSRTEARDDFLADESRAAEHANPSGQDVAAAALRRHQRMGITSIALPRRICSTNAAWPAVARWNSAAVATRVRPTARIRSLVRRPRCAAGLAFGDAADQHAALAVDDFGALEPGVRARPRLRVRKQYRVR